MGEPQRVHFFLVAMAVVILGACSSEPSDKQAQTSAAATDRIQGKIQVLAQAFGSADASLNEGSPVVYLWQGVRRYTLYFRKPIDVVQGNEYVVEGVNAQRVIDEIGDPDGGRNGYPLLSSCERVVRMAWSGLPFDEIDGRASALRARVKRYPARPLFLVTKIRPVTPGEGGGASSEPKKEAADAGKKIPEVSVAADRLLSGWRMTRSELRRRQRTVAAVSAPRALHSRHSVARLEAHLHLRLHFHGVAGLHQRLISKLRPGNRLTELRAGTQLVDLAFGVDHHLAVHGPT